jgi:hypothetical protein
MGEFMHGKRENTEVIQGKTSYWNWLKQILAQKQPVLDHVEQDEEGSHVPEPPNVLESPIYSTTSDAMAPVRSEELPMTLVSDIWTLPL